MLQSSDIVMRRRRDNVFLKMYLCVVCVSSLVMLIFICNCNFLPLSNPFPSFKFFFWVFFSKFIVMRQQTLICIPLKIDMWASNVLYVMKQPVWVPVLVQYRLKWLSLYLCIFVYYIGYLSNALKWRAASVGVPLRSQ